MVLHGMVDRGHAEGCDVKEKWPQMARGIKCVVDLLRCWCIFCNVLCMYMVGAFNYSIESIEDLLRQVVMMMMTTIIIIMTITFTSRLPLRGLLQGLGGAVRSGVAQAWCCA